MSFLKEIEKRRTFGIISHPDAGKTTLTEKLLLFGGAIQEAGAVKSNKIKKGATQTLWKLNAKEVFLLLPPFWLLSIKTKKLIFLIPQVTKTLLKIPLELLLLLTV